MHDRIARVIALIVLFLGVPVIALAQGLASLSLSPTNIAGGQTSTGQVTLTGPAPSGGLAVHLHPSQTGVANVPALVTVPAGATTASFTVRGQPVSSGRLVNITASAGVVVKSAQLIVGPPVPSSVTLEPTSITGGTSATGRVTLTGVVAPGPFTIQLSSSNPAVAAVPQSVTIFSGPTASFTVTTVAVAQLTAVTIAAGAGGVTIAALLPVLAPALSSLTLEPTSITGGKTSTGQVTLTGPAPSGGLVVQLSSSNPAMVTVPASVIAKGGETRVTFTVLTALVKQFAAIMITASAGGGSKPAVLVVNP